MKYYLILLLRGKVQDILSYDDLESRQRYLVMANKLRNENLNMTGQALVFGTICDEVQKLDVIA